MKYFWGFIVGAIIMAIVACLMEGMADEAEIREKAIVTRYERQLAKCNTGNYCKVEGAGGKTYRFLTIAERRLP